MTEKTPASEGRDEESLPKGRPGDSEAMGALDRPLDELFGIEICYAPEHLSPPVDEERLLSFIREELPRDERDEIRCLIASFRPWHVAWGEMLNRGARSSKVDHD